MDKNSIRRIIEDHIRALEGNSFQDFCDRMCMVIYEGDYTPVRPGGRKGDLKNDGYCPRARVFFAAHATRGEHISATKEKIKGDLEGCLEKHTDVQTWIYLTNDTLTGEAEAFIDEELRPKHKGVVIESWGHKKLAEKIYELPVEKIEFILGINLVSINEGGNGPYVDLMGIGPSGGAQGHFEHLLIKNIGNSPAVDCRVSIVGDNYEWVSDDLRLPKTLDANESLADIKYKISDEKTFDADVANLKAVIEYEDIKGQKIFTERELTQKRVPSGLFFNLLRGVRRDTQAIHTTAAPPQTLLTTAMPVATLPDFSLAKFEYLIENSQWSKEDIDDKEVWVCAENALFQIVPEDDSEEFSEPWTQVYPDTNGSGRYTVSLKIIGVTIKQITFVYCDGGRISVPLPDLKIVEGNRAFSWRQGSLDYKLGQLVGSFYIYDSIEGVAAMSQIELV